MCSLTAQYHGSAAELQSCLLIVGAIKDSIVSTEALVRHLLWELANQPQFAGKLPEVSAAPEPLACSPSHAVDPFNCLSDLHCHTSLASSTCWSLQCNINVLWALQTNCHTVAVPSRVSGQKNAAVKKTSVQSAVETAVSAIKRLQADTCAQNSQAQHAAATTHIMGTSAIHVGVEGSTGHAAGSKTFQVIRANTTGPQETAVGGKTSNANDDKDSEVDKADVLAQATEQKQQVKRDQVNTGLDRLHYALRLDVLDVDRLNATYQKIIEAYRTGELGRYTLGT